MRELLELLAQGRDNTRIAAVMGLSQRTVRNQVSMLFGRLGVESRSMTIVLARENGLGQHKA
jgi:DNA-binding NarL/FixJ family response regulator